MWRAGSEKWPWEVSGAFFFFFFKFYFLNFTKSGAFEISLGQGIFLVGRV